MPIVPPNVVALTRPKPPPSTFGGIQLSAYPPRPPNHAPAMNDDDSHAVFIPAWIMADSHLTPTQKIIAGRVLTLAKGTGYCWASNKTLGLDLGCGKRKHLSSRQVSEHITHLFNRGHVGVRGDGPGRKLYPITPELQLEMMEGLAADLAENRVVTEKEPDLAENRVEPSGIPLGTQRKTAHYSIERREENKRRDGNPANALVQAWVESQPVRPPDADIRKHAAVAKRIASKATPEQIGYALKGITQLYPHDREGWDLFDLERKFSKAASLGAANGDLRGARDDRELEQWVRQRKETNSAHP